MSQHIRPIFRTAIFFVAAAVATSALATGAFAANLPADEVAQVSMSTSNAKVDDAAAAAALRAFIAGQRPAAIMGTEARTSR